MLLAKNIFNVSVSSVDSYYVYFTKRVKFPVKMVEDILILWLYSKIIKGILM